MNFAYPSFPPFVFHIFFQARHRSGVCFREVVCFPSACVPWGLLVHKHTHTTILGIICIKASLCLTLVWQVEIVLQARENLYWLKYFRKGIETRTWRYSGPWHCLGFSFGFISCRSGIILVLLFSMENWGEGPERRLILIKWHWHCIGSSAPCPLKTSSPVSSELGWTRCPQPSYLSLLFHMGKTFKKANSPDTRTTTGKQPPNSNRTKIRLENSSQTNFFIKKVQILLKHSQKLSSEDTETIKFLQTN